MDTISQHAERAGAVAVPEKTSWHRYVPFALIPAYIPLGWEWSADEPPLHAPHGCYAVVMTWGGVGEPVEPADEREAIGGGAE